MFKIRQVKFVCSRLLSISLCQARHLLVSGDSCHGVTRVQEVDEVSDVTEIIIAVVCCWALVSYNSLETEAESRSADGKGKEKDDKAAQIEAPDDEVKLSLPESIVSICLPISRRQVSMLKLKISFLTHQEKHKMLS